MLVVGAACRLPAPLLVSGDRAEIGDFHNDGVEWTGEGRRERVLCCRH